MGLLLLVIGGWYTRTIWNVSRELGETAPPLLPLAIVATIALIAGAVVSHAVIAAINPEEADDSEDERDKLNQSIGSKRSPVTRRVSRSNT